MELHYWGHSCFMLRAGRTALLTDPFLSGNAQAAVHPEDVQATHILVSHAHDDHLGDADRIARRCGSTVLCTVENAALFGKGVCVERGQPGGTVETEFGSVRFTAAVHGNGGPGLACGFLITIEEKKIYFAGDTALTMDMALLANEQVDAALLPIGGRFTMDPRDAVRAAQLIRPRLVIPMHYNTWPIIAQDPQRFARQVEQAGLRCLTLPVGGSCIL